MDEKKFNLELPLPKSIAILDPKIAEEVITQLKIELAGTIESLISEAAKRIVAQRLDLLESAQVPKKSSEESLKELNIQLAQGAVTKEDYFAKESKLSAPQKKPCKMCGNELEMQANFCRFCGTKQ